ncbi:hypothetical protein SAMN02910262_02663 [[Clostridium] aminophilum]|uniref:Uncharacterized protein n=1 Tax=[Clostridium] aminophilum TaxID=1526 RepID=A0A1I6KM60_9FIRM|nr:hypothetical protein SAMN02910262_02663 [[Clostridium] aminophilum]
MLFYVRLCTHLALKMQIPRIAERILKQTIGADQARPDACTSGADPRFYGRRSALQSHRRRARVGERVCGGCVCLLLFCVRLSRLRCKYRKWQTASSCKRSEPTESGQMPAQAEPTRASMGGGARCNRIAGGQGKANVFAEDASAFSDKCSIHPAAKRQRSPIGKSHPHANDRRRPNPARCLHKRSRPTLLWEAKRAAIASQAGEGRRTCLRRMRPPPFMYVSCFTQSKKSTAFQRCPLTIYLQNCLLIEILRLLKPSG